MGDEDTMYEPLLYDINSETLMNEDDFEIDMGSRDELQDLKQDPVLKYKEKLAAWERPWTSGKELVDRHSHQKRTVVTTTKQAANFDCGHVVIDSANEATYPQPHSLTPRFDVLADEDNFYFFLACH